MAYYSDANYEMTIGIVVRRTLGESGGEGGGMNHSNKSITEFNKHGNMLK